MALKRWEKLSEKTVMKNSHWAYNIDEFLIGGGEIQEYHYVHTLGSTMVIPLTNEKQIDTIKVKIKERIKNVFKNFIFLIPLLKYYKKIPIIDDL